MKALAIDTETTGLFDYSKPADAEGQPRLCQISAYLLNGGDEYGQEVPELPAVRINGYINNFIKPDGWEYPTELGAKFGHGRNTAFFEANGLPVAEVLANWLILHEVADVIVGFNVDYDLKVMRGALRRAGMADHFGEKPKFCTMRKSAKLCDLRNVKGGFKNPTLAEAHQSLLGEPFADAHDARADNLANIRLFRELLRRGVEVDMALPVSKPKREPAEKTAPKLVAALSEIDPTDDIESFLNS